MISRQIKLFKFLLYIWIGQRKPDIFNLSHRSSNRKYKRYKLINSRKRLTSFRNKTGQFCLTSRGRFDELTQAVNGGHDIEGNSTAELKETDTNNFDVNNSLEASLLEDQVSEASENSNGIVVEKNANDEASIEMTSVGMVIDKRKSYDAKMLNSVNKAMSEEKKSQGKSINTGK